MSYDSVEILQAYTRRSGVTLPLLADPDHEIIDAFGIVNTGVPKDSPYYGFAYAGYYLVDAEGVVTAKYFGEENNDRTTSSHILISEFGAEAAGQGEAKTDHLALRWSTSNTTIRPGQRAALVLEIDIPEGLHVYAPGVEGGYIPIDWQIDDIAGVELPAVDYPEAVKKHLAAIGETVPVYQGKLRLVRDLRVLGGPDPPEGLEGKETIEVAGTFRYQACDAEECYFPQTLPLRWALDLEAHDMERVPEEIRRGAGAE